MLNIAKEIYIGYDPTKTKNQLPEAEVIPFGESPNEKRKLESLTSKYPFLFEHNNIPLPGFTLYRTDRWKSNDPSWLVIDPRGFLVRIGSQNLENIMHVTGITEGLIQQKCVWARENSETKMTLVPISSVDYINAVMNTKLLDDRVDIKDVQIGDKVLLQNGMKGTYLGVLSMYGPLTDFTNNTFKPQIFLRRQIVEITPGSYFYQTDAKILKILDKTANVLTREQVASRLNQEIKLGNPFFTSSSHMSGHYYGVSGKISFVSTNAVPKLGMTFEKISDTEAKDLFSSTAAECDGDIGKLMIETAAGEKHLIDFPYQYNRKNTTPVSSFFTCNLETFDMNGDTKLTITECRPSRSFSFSVNSASQPGFSIDNYKKFYKIVKHVKNETYI